jgi:hypothetical protein
LAATRQRSKRDSKRWIAPSAPSASSRRTVRKSPSQRRLWYGAANSPRCRASSASTRASADVVANGLSTTTCSPAASARIASGACAALGAAITARSKSSARSSTRST